MIGFQFKIDSPKILSLQVLSSKLSIIIYEKMAFLLRNDVYSSVFIVL